MARLSRAVQGAVGPGVYRVIRVGNCLIEVHEHLLESRDDPVHQLLSVGGMYAVHNRVGITKVLCNGKMLDVVVVVNALLPR